MGLSEVWETLALNEGGKIIYLILDGLGGAPYGSQGLTELQAARKPNLDRLAEKSSCGLLEIVGAGITPGSGPGHMALFGYDPLQNNVGRGVFSALGIDFPLQEGDVAARLNFCTIRADGVIIDRRAGRISTAKNEELCEKLRTGLQSDDVTYFLRTESEHRAVLIMRGENLGGRISDVDPGMVGHLPKEPIAEDLASEDTVRALRKFLKHAHIVLKDEPEANMVLSRGVEKFERIRGLKERFLLEGLCISEYPMYKGVSRLLRMDVIDSKGGIPMLVENLKKNFSEKYNFYFVHIKYTDKAGEDGDFSKKVGVIEEFDSYLPEVLKLQPDVLVITGDHSTPASMKAHSWHPVPVLLHAKNARIDTVNRFDEISCIQGALGHRPATDLIGLAMAHAGRLKKFGA